jgi:hypothetical protein
MGTLANVAATGADFITMTAALLHDLGEDAGGQEALNTIRQTFPENGERIATIVAQCSEALPIARGQWTPFMKLKYSGLEAMLQTTVLPESLHIRIGDKIDNLEKGLAAEAPLGISESEWKNMGLAKGLGGFLWTYYSLYEAIEDRIKSEPYHSHPGLKPALAIYRMYLQKIMNERNYTVEKIKNWVPDDFRKENMDVPNGAAPISRSDLRNDYPLASILLEQNGYRFAQPLVVPLTAAQPTNRREARRDKKKKAKFA